MTGPRFSRSAGDPRLYWLDDASWGPDQTGGFGLVLAGATTDAPAALSLARSFSSYPGYYVSIGQRPAGPDEAAFAAAVLVLVGQLGAGARFLWLASADRDGDWTRRVLYVRQTAGAATGTIDRPTVFGLGRYRFSVSGGQQLSVAEDGFAITGSVEPPFQLLTDEKAWVLRPDATALSVTGGTAGCFRTSLSLDATANADGRSDYAMLDVGFRYGIADDDVDDPFGLLSLHYPLFVDAPGDPIGMSFRIDPARTVLGYSASASARVTHYTSRLGYPVTLAPDLSAADREPGLVFHRTPRSRTELPGDDPLYLGPTGTFTMSVSAAPGAAVSPVADTAPAARLTAGISGNEYFGFSAGAAVPVVFVPGQAAFAADFPHADGADGADGRDGDAPAGTLTAAATVAHAALGRPMSGQAWYFAQPDDGEFFHVRATPDEQVDDDTVPYLVPLELVCSDVTTPGTGYPLTPYAGSSGNDPELVRALEAQVLSPLRRAAFDQSPSRPMLASRHLDVLDPPQQAATPQGILGGFTDGTLTSITLSPARPGQSLPQLAFNAPSSTFRSALLSNQLFMVLADPAELLLNTDFNYWITDAVLGDLARLTGDEAVPARVVTLLRTSAAARRPQTSLGAFTTMLAGVLTGDDARYRGVVTKYSIYFELVVEGWRFRLSPSLWAGRPHRPVLIVKYATGPLYDFVQNTDAWAWPQVAGIDGSIDTTRTLVTDILDAAIADVREHDDSNLASFVADVVQDPTWTGVLMLNADVPFSSVPPELAGLAAGIRRDEFRAHHVGLSVTPVAIDSATRTLTQAGSSVFGLIDYDQPEHIAHIDGDFDFKVLLLQVLFANSAVATFAGRIELFVNRLFAELVTLYRSNHYNNIVLDGSYQRQGGSGHYVFGTSEVSTFGSDTVGVANATSLVVLQQTDIDQVQFVTATRDVVGDGKVTSSFVLQGALRFAELAGFDAFSFGPTTDVNGVRTDDGRLTFTGLSVDMDVPVDDPDNREFRFTLDNIAFDPGRSVARTTSFFRRFPLRVTGLVRGIAGQTPKDLGFEPLATPLPQPGFTGEWFGLVMAVDLGSPGALSSSAALSANVLAAWSPMGDRHLVNVGVQLPGVESATSLAPIEGVLDLGFASIDLQATGFTDTPPDPAYVLRFRNFYLRLLGWKFPPGQNAIALFGNPDPSAGAADSDRGALGWYAAYTSDKQNQDPPDA